MKNLILNIPSALADGPAVPAVPTGSGASQTETTSVASNTGVVPPHKPSMLETFGPMILLFGVLYFVMIRPQQRKMKEQQKMMSELKAGDEVVTSSGILGTVRGLTDKVVTLEIADDVKIKVMKSQVNQVIKGQINDLA